VLDLPPGPLFPYAAPPPPPKPSRAGLIVSVLTGILAFLCLGAGTTTFFLVNHLTEPQHNTGRPVALPTADPADTPAAPATEPPESQALHTGDLRSFLMAPSAGARKWPHVKATETLTDTTAAAELAGLGMGVPGDLGEDDLDDLDFTDGCVRRWIDRGGAYVTVRIFRFDHTDGGVEFANTKAVAADGAIWGTAQRDVQGDPNAADFQQTKVSNGLHTTLVIGGFSDVAVLVTTQQRSHTTTVARSVFSAERRKL
jgi:hypothetical protein